MSEDGRDAIDEEEFRGRLLVVDDEETMRVFLRRALRRAGHLVEVAADAEEGLAALEQGPFDLVLTDIRMPGMDGLEFLAKVRARLPHQVVLVMTAHGSIPDAIEAMRRGAQNYVTKPFDAEAIVKAVRDGLATGRLGDDNRLLRRLLADRGTFEGMVGTSAAMRGLYRQIDQVADRRGVVLVQGESGVGKELVAQAIHARSSRADRPFVAFHCAAMPANLVAAELFGVEAGAFTGAARRREGALGRADGGTLFLDEIGEVPAEVQPALLRLLESGEVVAIGGTDVKRLDVRIVAATNRDLAAEVEAGRFRRDLYYRLNVFALTVPPLRQRRDDIPDLARRFAAEAGVDPSALSLEVFETLAARDWPGNVRELRNAVERLLAASPDGAIDAASIPADLGAGEGATSAPAGELPPLRAAVADFERGYLRELLRRVGGNVSEAARRAGISRPTLHTKLQQLGIDPDRFR